MKKLSFYFGKDFINIYLENNTLYFEKKFICLYLDILIYEKELISLEEILLLLHIEGDLNLFLTYLLKAFFIEGIVINEYILLDNEDKLMIANKVLTNINNKHIYQSNGVFKKSS